MVVAPDFKPHEKGTDWNDWAAKHGMKAAFDALLSKIGGATQDSTAIQSLDQAQRDAGRTRTTAKTHDDAQQAAQRQQSAERAQVLSL
jgi:hypothetical protein